MLAGYSDLPLAWMLAHPCSVCQSFGSWGGGLTEVVFQSHLMVPWGLLATDVHVSEAFVD